MNKERQKLSKNGNITQTDLFKGDSMKLIQFIFIATLTFTTSLTASAHSGRTDKQGCHLNHKTGVRHCH